MAYFESKQKFASVLNTWDNHFALVFALNTTRYKQYESTYADYEIIQIICKQAPCITTVIYQHFKCHQDTKKEIRLSFVERRNVFVDQKTKELPISIVLKDVDTYI